MIRRRHDCRQNEAGIHDPQDEEEQLPPLALAALVAFQQLAGPEDGAVPDEGAADAEGVAEVHRGHCGERVDVFARLPDGLRIVMADGVEEAVFGWEEARWHAGVEDEGYEGEEIRQSHGAPDGGKCGVRGRDEVVPGYEAVKLLVLVLHQSREMKPTQQCQGCGSARKCD